MQFWIAQAVKANSRSNTTRQQPDSAVTQQQQECHETSHDVNSSSDFETHIVTTTMGPPHCDHHNVTTTL